MRECKNFVLRFSSLLILVVMINIGIFYIFKDTILFKVEKIKNEKMLNKNFNVLMRYVEERNDDIFFKSKFITNRVMEGLKDYDNVEEKIAERIVEENNINVNYYIEIYNQDFKIVADSPGYIEKIDIYDEIKNFANGSAEEKIDIVSGDSNIYIKSFIKIKNDKKINYIAVVSYKIGEDFFDRVKEYISSNVNVYNKKRDIVITTIKGEKQEKIKKKSREIIRYDGKSKIYYSNREQSGIIKSSENKDVIYEVITDFEIERREMEQWFYYFIIVESIWMVLVMILLFRFMKKITGTEKEFWKKIKECMLGNDENGKEEEENKDYNILFYHGKDIFVKNISEALNCINKREDKEEKMQKFRDLLEIYNICFGNIKSYKVEEVEIIDSIKEVVELCGKYNILVDVRKNRSKMHVILEKNSLIYIFISVIYKLSEIYSSIKINVNIEDYGRKIFVRFKTEDTGIEVENKGCINKMFNKEFIDYLIMINNIGYAEKNGVVEISINV